MRQGHGRLQARLNRLAGSVHRCDGRIRRVVVGEYVRREADRCRLCGGCHVLVIKRKVVASREEIAARERRR